MHTCISYYYLTSFNRWYTQIDNGTQFYSPANKFQYSLPLFIFLQMMVAMVLFVQFKWKWGIHAVSLQQSTTVHAFVLDSINMLNMYNIFRTYINSINSLYCESMNFHIITQSLAFHCIATITRNASFTSTKHTIMLKPHFS